MLAQVRAFGYAGVGAEECSCGLVQAGASLVWRESGASLAPAIAISIEKSVARGLAGECSGMYRLWVANGC